MSFVDFFLNAPPEAIELELFEITHPDFSQAYRYVRNARSGVTVTLPNEGQVAFEYRPCRIKRSRESDDILQAVSIDVGDPGDVLATENDRLIATDGYMEKPALRFWSFRSDDLTVPLVGPLRYEVIQISTKGAMASIQAQAPERNASGTGRVYTFADFPMLRGEI